MIDIAREQEEACAEVDLGFDGHRLPRHSHLAYFWETEADFSKAVGFLEVGLRARDCCLIFGPPAQNEAVCRVLSAHGFDLVALEQSGRLTRVSGRSTEGGLLESLGAIFTHAVAQETPLIRLLGNLGWREKDWPSDEELLAFEAEINTVVAHFPCVILCLYDVRNLPGFIVQRAGFCSHPFCQSSSGLHENPFYLPPEEFLAQQARLSRQTAPRRQEEERQREMCRRYRALTEQSPFCVFYADSVGEILYVNERWSEVAGIACEQALGRGWLDAIAPEDRPRISAAWDSSVQSGVPFVQEYRLQHPDGKIVWVAAQGALERDRAEQAGGWVGTIIDVTERKRVEENLQGLNRALEERVEKRTSQARLANEALQLEGIKRARSAVAARHNQEFFTGFMANLPGMAFIKDREGRYVYGNAQFGLLLGGDQTGFLGKTDEGFWPGPIVREHALSEQRVLESNGPVQTVEALPMRDGIHYWLIHWFPLQEVRGRPELVAGVAVEITELRRTEEALRASERFARATINALSAHLCVIDSSGTIITVNQAWRDFSRSNASVPLRCNEGANYLEVCDHAVGPGAADGAQFAAGIRAVLANERDEFCLEYPCHSPAEERWFLARVTRFAEPELSFLVITHENVTARKIAQDALQQTRENLQRALAT